jgi:molybdopterin-guanine dinucleotide biosynthesis protein A
MGRPKALLPVNGEPMLLRVLRALHAVVNPIIVVAAVGQHLPPLPDEVLLVYDPTPDGGPLLGFATGTAALPPTATAAFLSSCDAPLLHPAFVAHMLANLGANAVAVPRHAGRLHPLAAAYRRAAGDAALSLVCAGQLRMTALFDVVPTAIVEDFPHAESLRNVNTPENYASLTTGEPRA